MTKEFINLTFIRNVTGGKIIRGIFDPWYSLMHKKTEKSILRFFIYKQFKFFFTCILPGYVFNESKKEFWKNSSFENMRANFIRRCQNSLRQNSPEIMHFQARKNCFLLIAFDSIKI